LFPIYAKLSDLIVLIIFTVFVSLLISLRKFNAFDFEVIRLVRLAYVAFIIFLFATIYFRQSLTQQLGGYLTTFPDRYFMGLNVLVVLIVITLFTGGKPKFTGIKRLKSLLLAAILALYILNISYIFELNKPRLNIVRGPTFLQSLCSITPADQKIINLPIYFNGWSMQIPSGLYLRTVRVVDCEKIISSLNKDFFLK
jgi:hypothetical protein